MTTPSDETKQDYLNRMSDDGGGGLATPSEIQANIAASFADLGSVYTSAASIPTTATERGAGRFSDASDAVRYLEKGGLVSLDNSGNVAPIGFVYFLEEYDEIYDEYYYIVYIDEDS